MTRNRWLALTWVSGLTLERYWFTDSFNAIYRKGSAVQVADGPEADFYAADLALDASPVTMRAGETSEIAITVASRGRAAWASRGPIPLRLGYHLWRRGPSGRDAVAFDNERTMLTSLVCPGDPQTFVVPVIIGEPGVYEIEFDLVHEGRTWFAERGGRTATATVTVADR